MKKIYLIGYEHLLPNGKDFYQKVKKLCLDNNYELIEPPLELFNPISSSQAGYNLAKERLELLKQADLAICNVNDYKQSVEPYGEVGLLMGCCLGLNIETICYMRDTRCCGERFKGDKHQKEGKWYDGNDVVIETGKLNLMLETKTTIIEGEIEDVFKYLKEAK